MKIDSLDLMNRLSETIAWCSAFARDDDLEKSLRYKRLQPAADRFYDLGWHNDLAKASALADLCDLRRVALNELQISVPEADLNLGGGWIVAMALDYLCMTGGSVANTLGFIDYTDLPAWDTWFYTYVDPRFGDCLVFWVPPSFCRYIRYADGTSTNDMYRLSYDELFGDPTTVAPLRAHECDPPIPF